VPALPRMIWDRRHLLGLEELSRAELIAILDLAEHFTQDSLDRSKKRTNLAGKVVVNLFFEPSTRTRMSSVWLLAGESSSTPPGTSR
jgi:aspartate carbamoyltransferase catalytic subunit